MSFPGLDSSEVQHLNLPGTVKDLLPRLADYLEKEFANKVSEQPVLTRDIVPYTLAKRLRIDESIALALLMIYDNAGIVKPRYHVLCPEFSTFLGSFHGPAELPPTIPCPSHENDPEKVHHKDEYFVDLVFRLTPESLKKYSAPGVKRAAAR